MEKHYHLKTIQKNDSDDFFFIAAAIYLDERRIGALHSCPETKEMEFEFALPMDRLVFENFISDWWAKADQGVYSGLTESAMIQTNSACPPPLSVKLHYWVKSVIAPAASTVQPNELAAA